MREETEYPRLILCSDSAPYDGGTELWSWASNLLFCSLNFFFSKLGCDGMYTNKLLQWVRKESRRVKPKAGIRYCSHFHSLMCCLKIFRLFLYWPCSLFTGDPNWAPQPIQTIISHDSPPRRSIIILWFRPPFQRSRIVVQSPGCVQLFANLWTAARQASLSFTICQSLQKLMSIELVTSHPCCPLLLLPSIFPSIRVFSSESALHIRQPKYWSFSFSISPSNEYSGLISFRMDWLDLLAVQETLKSLLQHHNSKGSILQCSAFFMLQLSYPYMTTGKTIALDICWQSNISAF